MLTKKIYGSKRDNSFNQFHEECRNLIDEPVFPRSKNNIPRRLYGLMADSHIFDTPRDYYRKCTSKYWILSVMKFQDFVNRIFKHGS